MKCSICGNEYPSQYYFAAANICNDCFQKMTPEEQNQILSSAQTINVDINSIRIGFGRRFGAFAIDMGIILVIVLAVMISNGFIKDQMALGQELQSTMKTDPNMVQEMTKDFMKQHLSTYLFMSILPLFYFLLEVFVGSSLGKLILGIQIGGLKAEKAEIGSLFFRYSLKMLSSIIGLIGVVVTSQMIGYVGQGIGLLFVLGCFFAFSSKRMAVHDMIAKTAVYFKKDLVTENE